MSGRAQPGPSRPATRRTNTAGSSTMAGSQPLTLTESHLSAEGFTPASPRELPNMSLEEEDATVLGSSVEADLEKAPARSTTDSSHEEGGSREDKPGNIKVAPGEKSQLQTYYTKGGDVVDVVDWDGPDDPSNPLKWSYRRRMGATLVVSMFTFLSPLSSTMVAPCTGQISAKFNITNEFEQSCITSIFVLAYAIAPLVMGPLSELYGRRIVLQLGNLIYLLFNLMCAFATNSPQILAFRFLAGIGGSAPITIGAGVLGDLWTAEERGQAAALYSTGVLLAPAIGPIFGGWVSEKGGLNGYKWVFYSSSIFCAIVQVVGFFYVKETYAPTLLSWRADVMRKERGLDRTSDKIQTIYELRSGHKSASYVVTHGLIRPFYMFAHESILQILGLYMAFLYGLIYVCAVTTTPLFMNVYGQSVGIAGTNFVAQGVGFFIWAQLGARLIDRLYRRLKAKHGVGKPEFRLPMLIPSSIFTPIGFLMYGWGAQAKTHWIVPDIGLAFIAAGMIGCFQVIQIYVIDSYTLHAASAIASLSSLRAICGFAFPLWSPYLFNSLGYGKGCTILAAIAALIGLPAAPILYRYGERIRTRSKHAHKHAPASS